MIISSNGVGNCTECKRILHLPFGKGEDVEIITKKFTDILAAIFDRYDL